MNGGMDYVRILRDLREDADKTQTQIAEVLGTSQTMYARYERGANELPIHHLITSAFFRFLQSAGAISCAFASTTLLSSASGRSAVK